MPVTNIWDNTDKTIMYVGVIGRWTWDEMYNASQVSYAMIDSVKHEVCVIIDFSQSISMPKNAMTHARNMIGQRHPRNGMAVFVGVNPIFVSMWQLFVRIYAIFSREQDYVFAKSLDEARTFLKDITQHNSPATTGKN